MKKQFVIAAVCLLVLAASACGKKEASTEGTAAETESVQATNPMEMVNDDTVFAKELGFGIDTSVIPVPGMARFIIDGKIAQLRFSVEKEGAEPVEVMFRATKKKELKDELSGLYGEASAPVEITVAGIPATQIDLKETDRVHHQYYFEKDGVYCVLVVTGELGQEEFETLFSSFYNALTK